MAIALNRRRNRRGNCRGVTVRATATKMCSVRMTRSQSWPRPRRSQSLRSRSRAQGDRPGRQLAGHRHRSAHRPHERARTRKIHHLLLERRHRPSRLINRLRPQPGTAAEKRALLSRYVRPCRRRHDRDRDRRTRRLDRADVQTLRYCEELGAADMPTAVSTQSPAPRCSTNYRR